MPFDILLGSTSRHVDWTSAEIEDVFAPTGDFCTVPMNYVGPLAPEGQNYFPDEGELLTISYTDSRYLTPIVLFRGPITKIDFIYGGIGGSDMQLEAQDMTYRLDSKLVAGVFVQRTVEGMVEALIEAHGPRDENGVLTIYPVFQSDSSLNRSILPKVFSWKRLSEVLQEIAEERRYVWWLDFDGGLHMIPQDTPTNLAPISNIRPLTDDRIGNFKFSVDIDDLKNVIYVQEFRFDSPISVFEPGDETSDDLTIGTNTRDIGNTTDPTITTNYGVASIDNLDVFVKEPTQTAYVRYPSVSNPGAGSPRSPGLAYVNASGDSGKILLIRNDPADRKFPADTLAYWTYKATQRNSIPEVTFDQDSIEEFRAREEGSIAGGNGEYQYSISFGSLEFAGDNPVQILHDYINTYLEQYSWPIIEGSFDVYYSYRDGETTLDDGFGWRAGQRINVFAEEWKLYSRPEFYKTGTKVAAQCLVRGVRTQLVNPTTILYTVQFTSKFSQNI